MTINRHRLPTIGIASLLLLSLVAAGARAGAEKAGGVSRFFFSGDGQIHLVGQKSNASFTGRYRTGPGSYDKAAFEAICRVFGAPAGPPNMALSLRLIEFLDLLEDRLGPGARMTITSGYRPPQYNQKLRERGALAAKASLHQYGMAADLTMEGVPARRIWEYVKALGFGGAGYYHGHTVHIDVGPARSWDEKSSGVGTGISDDNKLIGLVTDYDVYLPGEQMRLRFTRMTDFPIGVASVFALDHITAQDEAVQVSVFEPSFAVTAPGPCPRFEDIAQMSSIQWRLPADLPAGRYKIRAGFCNNPWQDMPAEISTPVFEVKSS